MAHLLRTSVLRQRRPERGGTTLRAGDLAEVRSGAEILETLDSDATLENLPFMPEMLPFLGRRFVVSARVERACDTHTYRGARRIPSTVILDDLRCDGSGHDGCGARCRIFWKEQWLRKVDSLETPAPMPHPPPALEALVESAAKVRLPDGSTVYRSQATELLRASEPVSGWSLSSFRRELACGNVRPTRFVRVMGAAFVAEGRKRVGFAAVRVAARVVRSLGLRDTARRVRMQLAPPREKAPPPKGLASGQLVQIRPHAEIERQLDRAHKTRGLYFDRAEMAPSCGRRARVLGRVERFIDEPTGRMVELKSDCYILDGVVCSGDRSERRWFCPRAIYPWWRESWLTPLEPAAAHADVRAQSPPEAPAPEVERLPETRETRVPPGS